MHALNPYKKRRPNFAELAGQHPALAPYVKTTEESSEIDFKDANALRALTTALLKEDWKLDVQLREDRLCPTVANRLDYVLHVLDLKPYLSANAAEASRLTVLDIGTGHVAIYPLLLHRLRSEAVIHATESDEISLQHTQQTLDSNKIPSSSISLVKADVNDSIFSLLKTIKVDMTMCNPPFFGSQEEMQEGSELKLDSASSAPTAAANELLTPGGEVQFVSQMITESVELRDRCQWFTSLIGKFASLKPLVDLLRSHKIENYFVKSIKPSKTTRWILGWSYGEVRLPDSVTRPEEIIPGTSYAKLLPLPNRMVHTPLHPPMSTDRLRVVITDVLKQIQLLPAKSATDTQPNQTPGFMTTAEVDSKAGPSSRVWSVVLEPKSNTWSRSARRQAAREAAEGGEGEQVSSTPSTPMIVVRISVIPPLPPSAKNPNRTNVTTGDGGTTTAQTEGDWRGATLALDFMSGKSRDVADGLWKFLLTKANLLGTGNTSGNSITPESRSNPYLTESTSKHARNTAGRGGRGGRGRGTYTAPTEPVRGSDAATWQKDTGWNNGFGDS